MASSTGVETPVVPEPSQQPPAVSPPRGGLDRRKLGLVAGALAAAWVLPLLTHLVHADVVLPLVILVGTASLLRGGTTLLDRLVLAAGLLIGVVSAGGYLLSVWPWHLQPVPVAGVALSALVLVAVVTGRRPALPLRVPGRDVLVAGLGVGVAALLAWPFRGQGFAGRLALVMPGEDIARHFTLYDTIRGVGGYVFLHWDAASPHLQEGLRYYPQGSHFFWALIDNFVRSGTDPGSGASAFTHYLGYDIASYAFFALAAIWAARWVAGPAASGWRQVAICTLVAACVGFSDLLITFERGGASELFSYGPLALLLAVLARPLRQTREWIVVVAALLVAVGTAYYFVLPVAGVVTLAALVTYTRRIRRVWRTALVAAVIAGPLAFAQFALFSLEHSPVGDLTIGTIVPTNRNTVVAVCLAGLLGAATYAGRRSPVWRVSAVATLAGLGFAGAVAAYQLATTGVIAYYFEKALHLAFVVGLVGIGAAGLLLRPRLTGPVRRPAGRRRWTAEAVPALLAAVLALAMVGGLRLNEPAKAPSAYTSWGVAHLNGEQALRWHAAVTTTVLDRYSGDGRVTLIAFGAPISNYLSSMYLSALERNYGVAWAQVQALNTEDWPNGLVDGLHEDPVPIRVVTTSPEVASQIEAIRRADPELDIDLVQVTKLD